MSGDDPLVTKLELWMDVFMRRSTRDFIKYARTSGLSMSQLGVLFHLNKLGTSGVTDLGEHLGVTSAAASQLLDRLVHQGLIERSEDPNDRRVKRIVLTDSGSRTLKEGIQARQGWLADLVRLIPENDKKQIKVGLDLLIEKANQLE
jgi:DNA-binding MarR family transcriptional regulator